MADPNVRDDLLSDPFDANYRGDLCVEDESLGRYPQNEQADILRKEIALFKGLV